LEIVPDVYVFRQDAALLNINLVVVLGA